MLRFNVSQLVTGKVASSELNVNKVKEAGEGFGRTDVHPCWRWTTKNRLPLLTAPPLLCLIMKRAIFSCSLAAASSAWLKLGEDLPGGFGTLWLTGWMTVWMTGRLVGCLVGGLVGGPTGWLGVWRMRLQQLTPHFVALACCTRQPLYQTTNQVANTTRHRHSVIYRKTHKGNKNKVRRGTCWDKNS